MLQEFTIKQRLVLVTLSIKELNVYISKDGKYSAYSGFQGSCSNFQSENKKSVKFLPSLVL